LVATELLDGLFGANRWITAAELMSRDSVFAKERKSADAAVSLAEVYRTFLNRPVTDAKDAGGVSGWDLFRPVVESLIGRNDRIPCDLLVIAAVMKDSRAEFALSHLGALVRLSSVRVVTDDLDQWPPGPNVSIYHKSFADWLAVQNEFPLDPNDGRFRLGAAAVVCAASNTERGALWKAVTGPDSKQPLPEKLLPPPDATSQERYYLRAFYEFARVRDRNWSFLSPISRVHLALDVDAPICDLMRELCSLNHNPPVLRESAAPMLWSSANRQLMLADHVLLSILEPELLNCRPSRSSRGVGASDSQGTGPPFCSRSSAVRASQHAGCVSLAWGMWVSACCVSSAKPRRRSASLTAEADTPIPDLKLSRLRSPRSTALVIVSNNYFELLPHA
jgi:hypothetical protein